MKISRRQLVVFALSILASLLCAIGIGYLVHDRLLGISSGKFVAASVSPNSRWQTRKMAILPTATSSLAWKVEVRSRGSKHSSWRTVYLGSASHFSRGGAPRWLDGNTITVSGHKIDVRGRGYSEGWVTTLETVLEWAGTIAAAVLVLAAGIVCGAFGKPRRWYFSVLKKYAVFKGRAARQEYWYFALCSSLIAVTLFIIDRLVNPSIERFVGLHIYGSGLLSDLYALALLIPGIAVVFRRLHDTGRSGWWYLLGIPYVAAVIVDRVFGAGDNALLSALLPVSLVGSIVLLVFKVQASESGET